MTTVTARIDEGTSAKLQQLAKATNRSRSWLVADALRRYTEAEGWQVAKIQVAVAQADAGAFASDGEVADAFGRWGVDAR